MDEQTLAILHESLLTEAWHNAEVATMVFDDERTFLTANAAYLDLLGYARSDMARRRQQLAPIRSGRRTGRATC